MESRTTPPDAPAELAAELSAWAVGGGLITVALFPLALPFILLTLVAVVPLLAVGLVLALLAAPILLLRRLLRAVRAPRRPEGGEASLTVESALPVAARGSAGRGGG